MPSEVLKGKVKIGFDPNLFTKNSLSIFGKNELKLKPLFKNLIDEIWKRKIEIKESKFFKLPNSSGSEKYQSKINKIANF